MHTVLDLSPITSEVPRLDLAPSQSLCRDDLHVTGEQVDRLITPLALLSTLHVQNQRFDGLGHCQGDLVAFDLDVELGIREDHKFEGLGPARVAGQDAPVVVYESSLDDDIL